MREKLKQWAWRTLLTLTCLLITTPAWADVTIYVNPSNADYYMHYWGDGITGTSWPGVQFSSNNFTRETIGNINWYKITFTGTGVNTANCIFNEGEGGPQTGDIKGITGTKFYTYNGGSSYSDVTSTYSPYLDIYTVVGDNAALFGETWNLNYEVNNMITTDYDNYTLTKENVELTAGNIQYKVARNHDYTNGQWPYSGNNTLVIPANGKYNVTFTFKLSENSLNATATAVNVAPSTPVFSLESGSYDTNQSVTISSTAGATIYYTTDGSDPTTSSTVYSGAIALEDEGTYTIKAIAVNDYGTSSVATAEYTIAYQDIYLFGSVGIQHAWNFSNGNYKLATADGITYTGAYRVNKNTAEDVGYFILGSAEDITWGDQRMIGSNADGNNWDITESNLGTTMTTVAGSEKPWKVTTGEGVYEFDFNRVNNTLVVTKFHGGTSIFVYDYARPYIYVKDSEGTEFNGEYPGANINIIDETVGGTSGLSSVDAEGKYNFQNVGTGKLAWYEFPVPSTNEITFELLHNSENTVTSSKEQTAQGEVYYYWDGTQYVKLNSRNDAANLRRIVAHVRVQGTEVPTCNGVKMNGPSSFYGQMYYWMAVTTAESAHFVIADKDAHGFNAENVLSDFYVELVYGEYKLINKTELESRLANKTGVGTIIHLQKNSNTPEAHDSDVLGVNTWVWSQSENANINTTNLGRTWWGRDHTSEWAGSVSGANYANSRFIYQANVNGNADVYVETTDDGAEWYTWYEDNSVASATFGYGTADATYPTDTPNKDKKQFYMNYESPAITQQAGELWYVWTPDFSKTGNDNGELIDVTRTYESRAKQKALCSTVREGNYVYYTDIKGWGDNNIFCYVFKGTSSLVGPWPGIQMTKIGYDDEGHPVYLIDLSNYDLSGATGIIFNNGKEDTDNTKAQTGNLEWANGGCYDYLGLLYRVGGNIDVIENEPDGNPATLTLRGVWYSRVKHTLFAKDDNNYNNKSVNGYGYVDYGKSTGLQDSYDQSNWVEIMPYGDITEEDLFNLINKEFVLYGMKLNSVNPLFEAISIKVTKEVEDYTPNKFVASNFMGMYQTSSNGTKYFFVQPKPNELVDIERSIYVNVDADGKPCCRFVMNTNTGLDGSFNVDWTYHDPTYLSTGIKTSTGQVIFNPLTEEELSGAGIDPVLTHLTGYSGWLAIVKVNAPAGTSATVQNAPRLAAENTQFDPSAYDASVLPSADYTVYPICLDSSLATGIETIGADKAGGLRTLKCTRYYNLMGVESSSPFEGVNIVVKEYSDGTRESSKMIVR